MFIIISIIIVIIINIIKIYNEINLEESEENNKKCIACFAYACVIFVKYIYMQIGWFYFFSFFFLRLVPKNLIFVLLSTVLNCNICTLIIKGVF